MPKSKMPQKEIDQWINLKFATRSNRFETLEFERLETGKTDLILKGARRLLMKLQS